MAGGSWLPQVVASGNSSYVTWSVLAGTGLKQQYFADSQNSGLTWSHSLDISKDSGSASNALVDANGQTVLLLWMDTTSGSALPLAAYSINGGTTFSAPLSLSNSGVYSEQQNDQPELVHNGNMFFASWLDSGSKSGHQEVFFNSGTVP
jgi:hypothetical protein